MPEQRVRRAGESRAGKVPALPRVHHQLIPGDAAAPRLVRIGDEPRPAVARSPRCDRKGVGARFRRTRPHRSRRRRVILRTFRRDRLVASERAEHALQPEEERRAHHEPHSHIAAVDREQLRQLHLARMPLRIAVQPGGIAVEQRAHVARLLVVVAVHRRARVKQVDDVLRVRPLAPGDRAQPPRAIASTSCKVPKSSSAWA